MNAPQHDLKTLDRLLAWLAAYVALLALACWAAGALKELLPILTHLISGFSGAAFAVMRLQGGEQKERAEVDREQ